MFILLVDDDQDDQYVFKDCLESIGASAQITVADNGFEALQKLQQLNNLPDIIFLDMNMPKMNGKTLLKELKTSTSYSSIPVIVYSTSSSPEDVKEVIALGAKQFITKPHSYDELCKILSNLLN